MCYDVYDIVRVMLYTAVYIYCIMLQYTMFNIHHTIYFTILYYTIQ